MQQGAETCWVLSLAEPPESSSPSVSKRLFDGLKVKAVPALPGGLLLPCRNSSTLHPQLSLVSSVQQLQGDGGVVLWLEEPQTSGTSCSGAGASRRPRTQQLTAGPGPEAPPHLDPLVRDLQKGLRSGYRGWDSR